MVKYTLKLRIREEPNSYGEYNELILKDVLGQEIPRKEDIIDSKEIKDYLQRQDRIENTHHALYFSNFGNSIYTVTNIEHFLTDKNNNLEAKTIVTAVKNDKSR